MNWTGQQSAALLAANAWLRNPNGPQVFRLFGWAGTGKSTLAIEIGSQVRKTVYGAFTGKAALVMRKKGCRGATTLHQLMYVVDSEKGGEPQFRLSEESPIVDADLVVIDEVSMVDEALGRDLMSFGRKILVLGDPFQLPPIKGAGFFTDNVKPDIMLTEIHRQAADNPIIHMSMDIRNGVPLKMGTYGESKIITHRQVDQAEVMGADQLLVGLNKTRSRYNDRVRDIKRFPQHEPVVGDRLICLRNNRQKAFFNGQMFDVTEVLPTSRRSQRIKLHADPEGASHRKASAIIMTHKCFFLGTEDTLAWEDRRQYDEFTFGYAITVHKSQGSQWDNVYLFDESGSFRQSQDRWLYTAVTRAAGKITIVRK